MSVIIHTEKKKKEKKKKEKEKRNQFYPKTLTIFLTFVKKYSEKFL